MPSPYRREKSRILWVMKTLSFVQRTISRLTHSPCQTVNQSSTHSVYRAWTILCACFTALRSSSPRIIDKSLLRSEKVWIIIWCLLGTGSRRDAKAHSIERWRDANDKNQPIHPYPTLPGYIPHPQIGLMKLLENVKGEFNVHTGI